MVAATIHIHMLLRLRLRDFCSFLTHFTLSTVLAHATRMRRPIRRTRAVGPARRSCHTPQACSLAPFRLAFVRCRRVVRFVQEVPKK
jgi:hypothetical protein